MKRIMTVLFVLLLAFSLVSCEEEPKKKSEPTKSVEIYDRGHSNWLCTIDDIPSSVTTWNDLLALPETNSFEFCEDDKRFVRLGIDEGHLSVIAEDDYVALLADATNTLISGSDELLEKVYLYVEL